MHDDSENTSVCSAVFEGEGGWPNSYNSRDDERGLTLKRKRPINRLGVQGIGSLTMTYFHTGIRTIIGAKAFHFPVRDGKEWYHFAMVVRQKLFIILTEVRTINL